MNKSQKFIVLIGLLVLLAMCLVPPWYSSVGSTSKGLGYGFLFSPPTYGTFISSIDFTRLGLQCVTLALLCTVAYFTLGWLSLGKAGNEPHRVKLNKRQRAIGASGVVLATLIAMFPMWDVSWVETQHIAVGTSLDDATSSRASIRIETINRSSEFQRGFTFTRLSTPSPTVEVGRHPDTGVIWNNEPNTLPAGITWDDEPKYLSDSDIGLKPKGLSDADIGLKPKYLSDADIGLPPAKPSVKSIIAAGAPKPDPFDLLADEPDPFDLLSDMPAPKPFTSDPSMVAPSNAPLARLAYIINVDFKEKTRAIRFQNLLFELAVVVVPTLFLMLIFREPVAHVPDPS